jgi:hypothetical protein
MGGTAGRLELEDISIDVSRADFVFASENALTAVDLHRGRAVAAPYGGTVSAIESAYVATYTFRASSDAEGRFEIQVRANGDTGLRTDGGNPLSFTTGPAGVVAIGVVERPSK